MSYLDNLLSLFKFDYRTDMTYQHLHCCVLSPSIGMNKWRKTQFINVHDTDTNNAWQKKIQLNKHTFLLVSHTGSESIKQFAICGIRWMCNAWLISGWLTVMWKWWKFGWTLHFATDFNYWGRKIKSKKGNGLLPLSSRIQKYLI